MTVLVCFNIYIIILLTVILCKGTWLRYVYIPRVFTCYEVRNIVACTHVFSNTLHLNTWQFDQFQLCWYSKHNSHMKSLIKFLAIFFLKKITMFIVYRLKYTMSFSSHWKIKGNWSLALYASQFKICMWQVSLFTNEKRYFNPWLSIVSKDPLDILQIDFTVVCPPVIVSLFKILLLCAN